MDMQQFWRAVLEQDAKALSAFFHQDAWVEWPCSNERFTLDEYLRANCEYPGRWDGRLEKTVQTQDGVITAVRVFPQDHSASYHVVSFICMKAGKIASMTEYWADDGPPPEWRQRMKIGRPIAD